MNQRWINKELNQKCILFFQGWGMDENAIAHIRSEEFDLCMFNDYQNITPIQGDLMEYQTVILIAWSLGVWIAEQVVLCSNITVSKSIAINGTSFPVHDLYGIPEKVFINTMENWNERNRDKFNRRMMGGNQNLKDFERFLSRRSIIEQKDELYAIYEMQKTNKPRRFDWDAVLIGRNDLIFSADNQENWWKDKSRIVETNQPHFPFAGVENWEQLIIS